MPTLAGQARTHADARYAIVASRWNPRIVDALIDGAVREWRGHGVDDEHVVIVRVPGAWEIPQIAAQLAAAREYVAIVALGCVVRGDTRHYEHVADGCAQGLMRVAIEFRLPVLNGVLAVESLADAEQRAGGVRGNKGAEVALAALEMADLWRML